MEPDKARSRTTQLGSPSRHPILQLDSLNRRRPLLLRLVPCLKALRLREFQWREQSLFPRLSMQLAEPINITISVKERT